MTCIVIRMILCRHVSLGEWTRLVSHLPPCSFFSVDKLPGNRGVMFGGIIPDGSGIFCSNNVILFQCSQDSLVSCGVFCNHK